MADLATPLALRVAATLRVADHIARGQRSASELAAAVNADADAWVAVITGVGDEVESVNATVASSFMEIR